MPDRLDEDQCSITEPPFRSLVPDDLLLFAAKLRTVRDGDDKARRRRVHGASRLTCACKGLGRIRHLDGADTDLSFGILVHDERIEPPVVLEHPR